jgi:hypothetical protein
MRIAEGSGPYVACESFVRYDKAQEEHAMWDETKRQRYNWLRDWEWAGTLTAEEKTELANVMQEICNLESTYLQPATARLQQDATRWRAELQQVVERNRQLEALIHRKEALLTRVNTFIAEATTEQAAVQQSYRTIMGEPPPTEEVETSR